MEGFECAQPMRVIERMGIEKEFWRVNELSQTVRACKHEGTCIGSPHNHPGSTEVLCAESRRGPYCELCFANHFKDGNGTCVLCVNPLSVFSMESMDSWLPLLIMLCLMLILVCACVASSRKKKNKKGGKGDKQHRSLWSRFWNLRGIRHVVKLVSAVLKYALDELSSVGELAVDAVPKIKILMGMYAPPDPPSISEAFGAHSHPFLAHWSGIKFRKVSR